VCLGADKVDSFNVTNIEGCVPHDKWGDFCDFMYVGAFLVKQIHVTRAFLNTVVVSILVL